ncbi:mRNA decay activator protein ZFP36L2 [Cajanus cajan]|uniref:mRNA decay activator protein ZFP36L2 n=1 Tax=Cajanus cajan TaxID=3821 RepID=UPI00098D9F6C|nr:mRNA decay activator protein ZFP36L2 [Cajanus cajan]
MKGEGEAACSERERNFNLMAKTELCRRFKKGACAHGSKCNYAHSTAELRRQPKFCRLFLQNKHCPYGRTCRYIHSTSATPFPELEKFDRHSCAEYQRMKTYVAAPSDGYPSAEHRIMQTSAAAAANVSTSSSQKNEAIPSYAVKRRFKDNELQKISRIYADWI